MFQYTTWGRKIFFNFQILFLTPFCNQKRYFCVFWPFYAQILTKNPQKTQKSKKNVNYQVFRNSTKCFNIQLGVEKYFSIFRFYFGPLFVTMKRYFCVFWPFYTQILTKKPKITNISKTMRFFTTVQNISIYNFGSKNVFQFLDFVFDPFL